MAGAAISGFVDGLFQGIGARHGWEDRKRNIGREKRADEIRDNVDRRAEAEHGRRMGVYDRQATDWERTRADEDFWKGTFQDAADAANAPVQPAAASPADQPSVSTSSVPAPAPPSPAQGVALELGIDPRLIRKNRGAEMMERLSPADRLAADAAAAVVTPRRAGSSGPQLPRGVNRGQPPAAAPAAGGGRQAVPPMNMPQDPRLLTEGPGPGGGMTELYEMGVLPRRYVDANGTTRPASPQDPRISPEGQAEFVRRGLAEAPNMPPALRQQAAQAQGNIDINRPSTSPRVAPPPANGASMGPQRVQDQPVPPAAPPVAPPPSIPMKAAATPQEKAASAATVETLDAVATPGVKDATVAATQAMGVQPGQSAITPAQYERGAKSFMDRYLEVGAPRVLEALISRGEFDKAEKFQAYMESQETRKAMKDMGIATTAFLLGDIEKGADHMAEVYNNLGYMPDGTTVVKEETSFTKDRDGQVNGLKITFLDEKTGKKFEQVFQGTVPDLLATMMPTLMPEAGFEYFIQQQAAAAENAKGVKAEEKEAAKTAATEKTAIMKEATELVTSSFGQLTLEQAVEQVMATRAMIGAGGAGAIPGLPGAPPAGPPVAYRPRP